MMNLDLPPICIRVYIRISFRSRFAFRIACFAIHHHRVSIIIECELDLSAHRAFDKQYFPALPSHTVSNRFVPVRWRTNITTGSSMRKRTTWGLWDLELCSISVKAVSLICSTSRYRLKIMSDIARLTSSGHAMCQSV